MLWFFSAPRATWPSRRSSPRSRQWPGADISTCPSSESAALLRIWPRSRTVPGRVSKSAAEWTRRRSRNSLAPCVTCAGIIRTRRRMQRSAKNSTARSGRLFYLAIPPTMFETVVEQLGKAGCAGSGARVIVEKPFGTDLVSAQKLNGILLGAFDEKRIFRIDHYLGKKPVHNMVFFLFTDTLL